MLSHAGELSDRADSGTANRWWVLAIVSIGTLSSTLEGGIIVTVFPALARAFDTDSSTVLWVTVVYWVSAVGLLMTLGWLGDVAGRRRVFAWGMGIFALGMLLSAAAFSIWDLLLWRVLQGIGSAMVLANVNALITEHFPARERGKALGVSGAVVGLGLTAGPFAGGFLIDLLDWRAVFYSRVPIAVVGALLAWWVLPDDRAQGERPHVDPIGAAALFGAMGSLLLIVNQGGKLGFTSSPVIVGALVAALSLPALAWSERRSPRPILEVRLFASRQYTFGLLVLLHHYLSQGGILLVAPFFMLDSLGYSATKMGIFIAAFSATRTFLAPLAGRLCDRYGPVPFLLLGNSLATAALFWISTMGSGVMDWALMAGLLLASAGSAFFEPVVTSVIMGSVPPDRLGTASASVALGRQTAFAVGVTIAGAVYAVRERAHLAELEGAASAVPEAIARGFSDVMLATVVFAALAVVFSAALRNRT